MLPLSFIIGKTDSQKNKKIEVLGNCRYNTLVGRYDNYK